MAQREEEKLPAKSRPSRKRQGGKSWLEGTAVAVAILSLLDFVLYANSLKAPFFLDDMLHIVQNPDIGSWYAFAAKSNRPLVALSLTFNFKVGAVDTLGYHLFNVFLHGLCAAVLFVLLRDIFGGKPTPALLVAAGFVAHPVQTEAVTYIISRSELLCSLFYLLALLLMARMLRQPGRRRLWGWWVAAALAAGLSAASKEVAVTLPAASLLYDAAFVSGGVVAAFRRNWRLHASQLASWVVLLCLLSSREYRGAGIGLVGITPAEYLATETGVVLHYLRLVFCPLGLCLDCDWQWAGSLFEPVVLVRAGVLAGILGSGLWLLRRVPRVGFGIVWFFLLLSPTSSVLPIADPVFEHRLYLAIAGPLICLVAAGYRLLGARSRKMVGAAVACWVVLVCFWGGLTVARNRLWNDRILLWRDTVARSPDKGRPHLQLGQAYIEKGMVEEAEREFKLAAKGRYNARGKARALTNLAGILIGKGRCAEARLLLARAIARYDLLAMPYYGLALCDVKDAQAAAATGERDRARALLQKAIARLERATAISPGKPRPRYLLATVLISLGRQEEGRAHLEWLARHMPHTRAGRRALKDLSTGGRMGR